MKTRLTESWLDCFKNPVTTRHTGILVVCHDNDPLRDLTPKGIVAAIRKLEASGAPIVNEYIVLNQWR